MNKKRPSENYMLDIAKGTVNGNTFEMRDHRINIHNWNAENFKKEHEMALTFN